MIYVFENNDNNASWVNGDCLNDEFKKRGIKIEQLPIPIDNGKVPILKARKSTNEVWYEYIEVQKSKEDIEKETFTKTLAELSVQNKKKDAMIAQLAQQISSLNIKIQQMEVK